MAPKGSLLDQLVHQSGWWCAARPLYQNAKFCPILTTLVWHICYQSSSISLTTYRTKTVNDVSTCSERKTEEISFLDHNVVLILLIGSAKHEVHRYGLLWMMLGIYAYATRELTRTGLFHLSSIHTARSAAQRCAARHRATPRAARRSAMQRRAALRSVARCCAASRGAMLCRQFIYANRMQMK